MKLTKSKLQQIIQEELENIDEGFLDWFKKEEEPEPEHEPEFEQEEVFTLKDQEIQQRKNPYEFARLNPKAPPPEDEGVWKLDPNQGDIWRWWHYTGFGETGYEKTNRIRQKMRNWTADPGANPLDAPWIYRKDEIKY